MISPPVTGPVEADAKRLMRGGATFAVAGVLQRAAPLLLLPVFAHLLSPTEFGEIGVIITVSAALSTLLGFGLETAVFRGYRLASDDLARQKFVNTVGWFGLTVPIASAAVVALLAGPTVARALAVPEGALILGCVAAAISVSSTLIPLTLLRAQERLRDYLRLTSVQVVLSIGLTLVFVAVMDLGVDGWMLASTLSALVLLIWGLATLGHRWALEMDLGLLHSSLRFGVPLVPHAFAHWGLAVSDRAIIVAAVGTAAAGPYYAAFLVSSPITLIGIALSQASQPIFADAASGRARPTNLTRVATSHALLVALVAAVVALVGPPTVLTLLPGSYAPAAEYIPWLALGACLFGLYLMPMNAITITAGHTRYAWIITAIAASVNLILNLALVPQVGAYAAAVNTAIGYAVLFTGMWAYMRLVCKPPLRYDLRRFAVGAILIGVACVVATVLSPADPALSIVVRAAVLGVLIALLVASGPLSYEARIGLEAIRLRHGETVR